jgi:hypothetical protein
MGYMRELRAHWYALALIAEEESLRRCLFAKVGEEMGWVFCMP